MNIDVFNKKSIKYVVTMFIPEKDVDMYKSDLQKLGARNNVYLTVQPCPFEGVEFLYRTAHELLGHASSADTRDDEINLFWSCLHLKPSVAEEDVKKIAAIYHDYLVGILAQDVKAVRSKAIELAELSEHFATPIKGMKE